MKVTKTTKTAVIIYYDPEIDDYRRVVFGEANELMDVFMKQATLVFSRIREMQLADPKTPKQMKKIIKETLPDFAKSHGADAMEDGELTLSYEVKKLK